MTDIRTNLMSKDHKKELFHFCRANNGGNYPEIIRSISIRNLRAHANEPTVLSISSPVTAICGANGTGKTTVLHACAASMLLPDGGLGYRKNPYFLAMSDESCGSTESPKPKIVFRYASSDFASPEKAAKETTVEMLLDEGGIWRFPGGTNRPKKHVEFIGAGDHVPLVEIQGWLRENYHEIKMEQQRAIQPKAVEWCKIIISSRYQEISILPVKSAEFFLDILFAKKSDVSYSQANMGFGEARGIWIIQRVESAPDGSVVLIEEPELALHPRAQFLLGCYFNEVAKRKRVQIIFTTHSLELLSALHEESRVLLAENGQKIDAILSLSALQCHSIMGDCHRSALLVVVEDEFSCALTRALLHAHASDFARTVIVTPAHRQEQSGGNECNVRNAVDVAWAGRVNVVGVLDEELSPEQIRSIKDKGENQYKTARGAALGYLPGQENPEHKVFLCASVKQWLRERYHYNIDDRRNEIGDHHCWPKKISQAISLSEEQIINDSCTLYAKNLDPAIRMGFFDQIKSAVIH